MLGPQLSTMNHQPEAQSPKPSTLNPHPQPCALTQASKLGDMLGLLVSFTEDPAQLKEQVSLHTPCTLSLSL